MSSAMSDLLRASADVERQAGEALIAQGAHLEDLAFVVRRGRRAIIDTRTGLGYEFDLQTDEGDPFVIHVIGRPFFDERHKRYDPNALENLPRDVWIENPGGSRSMICSDGMIRWQSGPIPGPRVGVIKDGR